MLCFAKGETYITRRWFEGNLPKWQVRLDSGTKEMKIMFRMKEMKKLDVFEMKWSLFIKINMKKIGFFFDRGKLAFNLSRGNVGKTWKNSISLYWLIIHLVHDLLHFIKGNFYGTLANWDVPVLLFLKFYKLRIIFLQ